MGETEYDVSALPNASCPKRIGRTRTRPGARTALRIARLSCRARSRQRRRADRRRWRRRATCRKARAMGLGGVNPAEPPSSLLFVGGQTVQQGFIPLIGGRTRHDGSIQRPRDLSYAPEPNGWETGAEEFPSITTEPDRTYARRVGLSLVAAGRPLRRARRNSGHRSQAADPVRSPARHESRSRRPERRDQPTAGDSRILRPVQCTVDRSPTKHDPAVSRLDSGRPEPVPGDHGRPAHQLPSRPRTCRRQIWLKTSFSLRDPEHRASPRITRIRITLDGSPNLTQPQIVRHDELVLQVRGAFGGGSDRQLEPLSQAANYYLQAVAAQYQPVESLDVPYRRHRADPGRRRDPSGDVFDPLG